MIIHTFTPTLPLLMNIQESKLHVHVLIVSAAVVRKKGAEKFSSRCRTEGEGCDQCGSFAGSSNGGHGACMITHNFSPALPLLMNIQTSSCMPRGPSARA